MSQESIRPHHEPDPEEPPAPPSASTASVSAIDDLLDEIDDVLETNAESFVRGFVQKGGQ